MTPGITMETVFGDGTQPDRAAGVMGALLGAGKRLITGESLFMTGLHQRGRRRQAAGRRSRRRIRGRSSRWISKQLGGQLICQKDSFLCAARGVSIGIAFQRRIGVGLFGGEGFIMQRLTGDGLAFIHAGGMLVQRSTLGPGPEAEGRYGLSGGLLTPAFVYDIQMVGAASRTRCSAAKACSWRR